MTMNHREADFSPSLFLQKRQFPLPPFPRRERESTNTPHAANTQHRPGRTPSSKHMTFPTMSYFLQSPIFAAPAALQPLWVSAPSYTLVPLQPAAAAPPSLVIQLRGASSTGTGASVPPNPVVQIRSVSSTGTGAGTGTGFTIRIVLYSHAGPSDEWWCRTALASSAERPTRERLVAEIARLAARHGIATWRQATLVVMRDSSVPRITDEVGPVRDENVARLLELGGTDGDGCDDNDDNTVEQAMACGPASYLYVLAGGQRGGRR